MPRPHPAEEIRPLLTRSIHGPNYWTSAPVTRLDLTLGAYDEISSADAPGLVGALVTALPGLIEHRCSVGERGGFVHRLRDGTYAPHIIEHVALELQSAISHEVGFGRARGGDRPGEYTVVFEHRHRSVGARAAGLAVELVQDAFAGTLDTAEYAITELAAIARSEDLPLARSEVACGITGGSGRSAVRWEMHRQRVPRHESIVEVPPLAILETGLPYSQSRIAVILDARPREVPSRYREPDRARQLVSVLADAVVSDGVVVVPSDDIPLRAAVRRAGRRIALYGPAGDLARTEGEDVVASADSWGGRIRVRCGDEMTDAGPLSRDSPLSAQVVGALAACLLREVDRALVMTPLAGSPPTGAERSATRAKRIAVARERPGRTH